MKRRARAIKLVFLIVIIMLIKSIFRKEDGELSALEKLSQIPIESEFRRLVEMKVIPSSFPYVSHMVRLNRRDSWANGTKKMVPLDDFSVALLPTPHPNQTIIKYFKESDNNRHLDQAYAQQDFNLMESMNLIFQEFSQFCQLHGIDYWISHGSLIGWYWNQKILPWDDDIDIQTSLKGLLKLQEFNQSMVGGRYLISVNPYILYREHQKDNVVDARFIDTQTGVFLDITGLALMEDGLLYCKSPHSYEPQFMFPLHLTKFENTVTWRIRSVVPVLKKEYSVRSMLSKYYLGSYWNDVKQEWVKARKMEKPSYKHMRSRHGY